MTQGELRMLKAKGQGNQIVPILLGALICGVFYFLPVPETLARCAAEAGSDGLTAMRVLGGILLAIVWWIGGVFPHWITTITMLLLWVVWILSYLQVVSARTNVTAVAKYAKGWNSWASK